jgi:hypothetical protein
LVTQRFTTTRWHQDKAIKPKQCGIYCLKLIWAKFMQAKLQPKNLAEKQRQSQLKSAIFKHMQ